MGSVATHIFARFASIFLLISVGATLSATAQGKKTTVVILGVDHSVQLVSEGDQPGMLTAFIEHLRPDAVCIERPPELAERRDFYEFTYEVQWIVLPYAASHGIEICPIDWIPPVEDQKLVFGTDLDVPPEIRTASDFYEFPKPDTLSEGFFAGDDPKFTAPVIHFSHESADPSRDFPRRLYLYRTFMQAQHIRAAAKAHRGGTLLVVIGYFHKPDLKGILSSDASIRLVEPSTIWSPSLQDAERVTSTAQLAAILRFNLLGQQSQTGNMNWEWMKQTLHMFEHDNPGGEAQLYRLRLNELTGHETDKELVEQYRTLVDELPPDLTFVWTGVKDDSRVDSYFDPFGNLTVRQRAMIELIRLLRRGDEQTEATRLAASLIQEVGGRKGFQLQAYISMFLPRAK